MANSKTKEKSNNFDQRDVRKELSDILHSVFHIDLITNARENLRQVDWFLFSVKSFHIGVIGVLLWSAFFGLILLVNYIFASQTVSGALIRISHIWVLIPICLALFALASSRRMERLVNSGEIITPMNFKKRFYISLISVTSFLLAGVVRWASYSATYFEYGPVLPAEGVFAMMILDGIHVFLLLIGLGGVGSITFEPKT